MVETAPELGPDGEPYFAVAPPRKKPVWPWVVAIVVVLFGLAVGYGASHLERESGKGWGSGTGDPRPIREFDPEFPSTALVEGLLDPPVELVKNDVWWHPQVSLLPDPAGAPALLAGNDRIYKWRTSADDRGKPFRTARILKQIVWTGPGDVPYMAITKVPGAREPETVNGIAADGSTRWSWQAKDAPFLKWIAPRFGANGTVEGCVVGAGGEDGLVGLKADGTVSWERPRRYVIYQVSTHKDLPGWVASATGEVGVESITSASDLGGDARDLRSAVTSEHAYVTAVVLFPGPAATPSVVLGGSVRHEPLLARIDVPAAGEKSPWRARPATEPENLALLEAPGRPRLFVVTTEGGELLLVDEAGSLRARVTMPHSKSGAGNSTYSLSAGPLGADGWAIVVELLHGTYVYRVHPEKLPAK